MFKGNDTIYSRLLGYLSLNDKHRQELKVKRGFNDGTIDFLQFKSADPSNWVVIDKLKQEFGLAPLQECSILDAAGNPAHQFTNPDFIIIPYINKNDSCYFFKSHKFGSLTGAPPKPYCNKIATYNHTKQLILCESEFKAAAMWQMGWNAIGLGGISTFIGKHLGELIQFLSEFNDFVVLFDNEEQNDPSLKSYKDSFKKRYAQYIYSYVMADRILSKLPDSKVRIGTLPLSWAVDGKIDIDTAVATGKKREDFEKVIANAVYKDQYRYQMQVPEKHKSYVNRKIESLCTDRLIEIDNNCYYTMTLKKKDGQFVPVSKELSNFIIHSTGTYSYNGNIRRQVWLESKFGDKTGNFFIEPSHLASAKAFKELALSRGDYICKATESEFELLVEQMFLDTDPTVMKYIDMVGRNEADSMWIFGNMAIKDDGTIIMAKDDEFRDDDIGWKVHNISNSTLPTLESEQHVTDEEILQHFEDAWGQQGVIALLYVVSVLFSNEVFKEFGMFPFCLIYGEKDSGKSTLSDAMMYLFGFNATEAAMNMAESTSVAITRKLSFFSSLPCRFDEFRQGERKIDDKASILRSIYNRQKASKGLRDPFGVREVEPKAAFIMIGEQRPSDPALQSRFIPIYIERGTRTDKTYKAMKWFYQYKEKLSHFTFKLLKEYKTNCKFFMENMKMHRDYLQSKSEIKEPRVQAHYAMLLAALEAFPPNIADKYKQLLLDLLDLNLKEAKNVSSLGNFWMDVHTMVSMEDDVVKYLGRDYGEDGKGSIHFTAIYECWKKFKQQRGGTLLIQESTTLKKYLLSQKYILSPQVRRRIGDPDKANAVNCISVDLNNPYIDEYLKEALLLSRYYAHTVKD